MQAPRDELTADASPPGALPGEQRNLRAADWLFRSRAASVLWLVARLWLGYGWRRPPRADAPGMLPDAQELPPGDTSGGSSGALAA